MSAARRARIAVLLVLLQTLAPALHSLQHAHAHAHVHAAPCAAAAGIAGCSACCAAVDPADEDACARPEPAAAGQRHGNCPLCDQLRADRSFTAAAPPPDGVVRLPSVPRPWPGHAPSPLAARERPGTARGPPASAA